MSPSAMAQSCNTFDASELMADATSLFYVAAEPDGTDDLLARLNPDGSLVGQTTHAFTINASDLTSGRYFVRVQGENFATSKMITLVK